MEHANEVYLNGTNPMSDVPANQYMDSLTHTHTHTHNYNHNHYNYL